MCEATAEDTPKPTQGIILHGTKLAAVLVIACTQSGERGAQVTPARLWRRQPHTKLEKRDSPPLAAASFLSEADWAGLLNGFLFAISLKLAMTDDIATARLTAE